MILTATPQPDDSPPSVLLQVSAIPAGTTTVTITRAVNLVPTAPVRGAEALPIVGTTTGIVDYEAPFGVPIVYLATAYDTTGAKLAAAQLTAELDVDEMWISDPLAPGVSTACRGVKAPESFANITYSLTATTTPNEGVELPIALTGVRQAGSGVPLVIIAEGAAEAVPIRQVLRYAAPFLLRLPVRWQVPLPALAYCLATSIADTLFGGVYGRSHITLTFDLVQPPGRSIAVPVRTYATLLAEASTYADLAASRSDYLDVLLGGD